MRIAIASPFACDLSWWLRLQDEGHDVAVWTQPKDMKHVGEGLVQKAGGWDSLLDWAKLGVNIGVPTMMICTGSGIGDKMEEARRWGLPVLGGGRFCDRLEKDRAFGFQVIEEAGGKTPPYETFDSFDAALNRAHNIGDTPVYFKSDRFLDSDATHCADTSEELVEYLEFVIRKYGSHGRCMLQKKVEGIPLSTARWWNGKDWVGPYEFTIEHKKFLNDELGPSTGCSFNAVWFSEDSTVPDRLGWPRLTATFLRANAPPGLYDMNSVIAKDGTPYFLEWTPRMGYDSEMTSARLFPDLSRILYQVAHGTGIPEPSSDLAYSMRLSVPPYPWEHLDIHATKTCIGVQVSGETGDMWSEGFIAYGLRQGEHGIEVAGCDGSVGLAYAQGGGLESLHDKAMKAAKALRVPGLQYRTDGAKVIGKDAKDIQAAGVAVHPDLMR